MTHAERILLTTLKECFLIAEEAVSDKHSPWCNGIHEGGMCEGDVLATRAFAEIEKTIREVEEILTVPEAERLPKRML
jgi:hypothetical protein